MNCPYCDQELKYHDYFGHMIGWKLSLNEIHLGDIFKCLNESCYSETFSYFYHVYLNDSNLREGYPC